MDKNIVIIHYNTPKMTECLVKSINRHMKNAKITVFDNSDKRPFTYSCDNLTVLDNTKGEIINFTKFLQQYPNRNTSLGRTNNFSSAKHCYTVEKLIEMFDDGFILLDSDTLVKKDLSELYDESIIYAGTVENQPKSKIKRVLPYLCYINSKMCKDLKVHYFDENYMHGLKCIKKNRNSDNYDTGSGFYLKTENIDHKEIDYKDYIVHFGHGSWNKRGETKTITNDQWLYINREYWSDKNKKAVYTCVTNGYDKILEPTYITMDFDYIYFTDNNSVKSDIWQIRPLPKECDDIPANKKQRLVKILPHLVLQDYDLSIWIDGNIEINGNLNDFVKNNANDESCSVFIPKHPHRDCIYDEQVAVIKFKKDVAKNTNPQIEEYKKEGFPKHYGLVQTGIMIRRHNDEGCKRLMEAWFNEVKEKSHRDQLSFNYVLWKNDDVKMKYIDKKIFRSKWMKLKQGHIPKRSQTSLVTRKIKPNPTVPKKVTAAKTTMITKMNSSKVEAANKTKIQAKRQKLQQLKKARKPKGRVSSMMMWT